MCDYKITRNDCITILRKHLQHNDFEILVFEEKSMSAEVFGLMAAHFRLHITAKINNISVVHKFFVKRMRSILEVQNKMMKQQQTYEKETFMYEFLDKVVQLEPKYNLDVIAKCYFTVPNELFVLDDLTDYGYIANKSGDCQLDFDHFILAMDSLAKFHAGSIIYETKKGKQLTEEYSEFLIEPLFRKDDEYLGNKLIKSGTAAILGLMDLMPQLKNKEESKLKFQQNVQRAYDLVKPSDKFRNVICHGDLWSNNLLYNYAQDKPVHCKLVDFQGLRYCVPALDFTMLIYLTIDNKFVRDNKDELYRAYYSSLKKYLNECDIDINDHITWGEFEDSLKYALPFAIVMKIVLSVEIAFNFDETITTESDKFENFMYGNKTDLCVHFYKTNPLFKLAIDAAIETLDEL